MAYLSERSPVHSAEGLCETLLRDTSQRIRPLRDLGVADGAGKPQSQQSGDDAKSHSYGSYTTNQHSSPVARPSGRRVPRDWDIKLLLCSE